MQIEYSYKVLRFIEVKTRLTDDGISVSSLFFSQNYGWEELEFAGLLEHQKFDYSKEHPEFLQVLPPGSKEALDFGNAYQKIMLFTKRKGVKKLELAYLHIPTGTEEYEKILSLFSKKLGGNFSKEENNDHQLRKRFGKQIPLITKILSVTGCYIVAVIILLMWFAILYYWNELKPF